MNRVSVRVDDGLYSALSQRAASANLPFSEFVRSVLKQGVDPSGAYVFSSQDEILATCIQILSIVANLTSAQSPKALQNGMDQARTLLIERGLLEKEEVQ